MKFYFHQTCPNCGTRKNIFWWTIRIRTYSGDAWLCPKCTYGLQFGGDGRRFFAIPWFMFIVDLFIAIVMMKYMAFNTFLDVIIFICALVFLMKFIPLMFFPLVKQRLK